MVVIDNYILSLFFEKENLLKIDSDIINVSLNLRICFHLMCGFPYHGPILACDYIPDPALIAAVGVDTK